MPSTNTKTPLRILVVDDSPAIHLDFRKVLAPVPSSTTDVVDLEALLFDEVVEEDNRAHFVIDSAYQGAEAIRMVEAAVAAGKPYALAFVDVRMPPGISGIDTLHAMWRKDPDIQGVICTAYSDHTWADMVRTLGTAEGFLVLKKPFDAIEALQIAQMLTQKWLLGRELAELEHRLSSAPPAGVRAHRHALTG